MAITDFVKERAFKDNTLTLVWSKQGIIKYHKIDNTWENNNGEIVGEITQKFLDAQLKYLNENTN